MWEPQSNLGEEVNHSISKDDFAFSLRAISSRFNINKTSVIRLSNETSWVFPAFHFLPESTVLRRSDSSSEANFSSCQRSDVW